MKSKITLNKKKMVQWQKGGKAFELAAATV